MERKLKHNQDNDIIDLLYLFKALWKKAWAILLIGVIAGGLAFGYTAFLVPPQYSSSVLLYVNNSSVSLGSVSISASELSAAQSLVDTYVVILNNRTTMEEVIEKAGVDDSYQELMAMVDAEPVNDTEVFRVTVTTTDPYKAELIANSISEVLPMRVADIIEGSSMRVVDSAVANTAKVSPSITKNTAVGVLLGCLVGCALFAVIALLDDTIRNEDHIVQTYDLPILAKIPNLTEDESKPKYGYYAYRSRRTGSEGNGGSRA